MKRKIIFLIFIGIAGIAWFCFREKGSGSQQKVENEIFSTAVETARRTIDAAQTENQKEFAEISFDFRKNRNGYYECYQLLRNVRPPADAKWIVRRDLNNGNINVSCSLDKKRKLLIVLKTLPDNSMKFAFACTSNS